MQRPRERVEASLKTLCTSCGRRFTQTERYVRCPACRELAKVYLHQLHRRRGVPGYRIHNCDLCRKHHEHVRTLRRRWDKRGIYVWTRCDEGHRFFRYGGPRESCPTCAVKTAQAFMKSRGMKA